LSEVLREVGVLKTYTLKEPVDYAGVKIYQLEFRALRAKDHIAVEKLKDAGVIEKTAMYLQIMTRQDPYVIENLGQEDFMSAVDVMNSFLELSPKTSGTTKS
jgi:hypothetical protein